MEAGISMVKEAAEARLRDLAKQLNDDGVSVITMHYDSNHDNFITGVCFVSSCAVDSEDLESEVREAVRDLLTDKWAVGNDSHGTVTIDNVAGQVKLETIDPFASCSYMATKL